MENTWQRRLLAIVESCFNNNWRTSTSVARTRQPVIGTQGNQSMGFLPSCLFCRSEGGGRTHQGRRNVVSHRAGACRTKNRRMIVKELPMAMMILFVIVIFESLDVISGDWIDPDTPEDVYYTEPYTARPYIPPPPEEKKKTTPAKERRRKFMNNHTVSPTYEPTASPSVSPRPSAAPSMPSEFPSMYPTATPGSFKLVFSDEFNTPFRSFEDGTDPRWTALDKNDYTNDALHYYSPLNAQTNRDGHLVITTKAEDTEVVGFNDVKREKTKVTKHFQSAMIQSWNKFCFTGGIIEAEAVMPGKSDVGGLWPAFWLLGNLARHTYVGSSEHIWPWSSTSCTKKSRTAQAISGCSNTAHYGLKPHIGRGAPEIDIFEVQPGNIRANTGPFLETPVGQPFMSASYQVAPGRAFSRPGPGYWPGPGQWYDGLIGGENASINILFYGSYNHFASALHPAKEDYWSDAISFNRQLTSDHFEKPHVYRLEWEVPNEEEDTDGHLHWFIDGKLVLAIDGKSIVEAGLGGEISSEPSYILFNTAVSKQWGFPKECPAACPCKRYDCKSPNWEDRCGFSEGFCAMMTNKDNTNFPEYKINWVRVYQNPDDETQKVGCSTPERPTRRYIDAHYKDYKTEQDVHMLKGIQRGRGICDPDVEYIDPQQIQEQSQPPFYNDQDVQRMIQNSCGGPSRGICTPGRVCECQHGHTGPHCLTHSGDDPILYDTPDKISDVGFTPPVVAPTFLIVGGAALVVLLVVSISSIIKNRNRKLEGWKPIP